MPAKDNFVITHPKVHIPTDVWQKFGLLAMIKGKNKNDMICTVITEYVEQHKMELSKVKHG